MQTRSEPRHFNKSATLLWRGHLTDHLVSSEQTIIRQNRRCWTSIRWLILGTADPNSVLHRIAPMQGIVAKIAGHVYETERPRNPEELSQIWRKLSWSHQQELFASWAGPNSSSCYYVPDGVKQSRWMDWRRQSWGHYAHWNDVDMSIACDTITCFEFWLSASGVEVETRETVSVHGGNCAIM